MVSGEDRVALFYSRCALLAKSEFGESLREDLDPRLAHEKRLGAFRLLLERLKKAKDLSPNFVTCKIDNHSTAYATSEGINTLINIT